MTESENNASTHRINLSVKPYLKSHTRTVTIDSNISKNKTSTKY